MKGIAEFNPKIIKVIVFDFDETLVHGTTNIKDEVWTEIIFPDRKSEIEKVNRMFDRAIPFPNGTYHQGDRVDRIAYMLDVWKENDNSYRTNHEVLKISDQFSEAIRSGILSKKIDKYDKETLRVLFEDKKYLLYVVSNMPEESLSLNVENNGITSYFSDLIGMPTRKVEALERITDENNCLPENVLMVGDGEPDHDASAAVGTQFVGVLYKSINQKWSLENFPKIKMIHELRQVLVI